MKRHEKPVMLIAGGTGSIGSEVAAQAIAADWKVVVQGSSEGSVNTALGRLRAGFEADDIKGVVADIRSDNAIEELVEQSAACFGRIDAVVDCLVTGPESGGITGPFETTEPENYLPFVQYSIVYLQRLAFAALPWLKKSRGCLVAFASDAGVFAAPGQSLIGSARAATAGFVRNLALDVAREGVRVHCIAPGFVDQTRTADKLAQSGADRLEKARKRAGLGLPTPRDIAPLVLFLCGDGARRITGQVISINGGLNA